MQSWIQELRQLGPPNLVLAITGNKVDMEDSRQVGVVTVGVVHDVYNYSGADNN